MRYQGGERTSPLRPGDPSFVEQYILPLVYPPGLTREDQILMGLAVLVINGLIYLVLVRRYLKKRAAR